MNMQKLMQEAAKMQRDITKKQEEINATNYEAQSGLVSIVLNGKKEIVSIKFDKNQISDADDIDALEDMIKLAFNDAASKIDKDIESKIGVYAKGVNGLM